jgi:twinkle protein
VKSERYASFEAAGIRLTAAERARTTAKTKCPSCGGSRKPRNRHDRPLYVHVTKKFWTCYNCGWEGGVADEQELARQDRVKTYSGFDPKPKYSQAFLDYWNGRGISENTLLIAKVYERTMNWQVVRDGDDEANPERMRCMVACIPYIAMSALQNVKMRPIPPAGYRPVDRFRQVPQEIRGEEGEAVKASVPTFCGIDRTKLYDPDHSNAVKKLRGEETPILEVIITEGESDMLSWVEAGHLEVMSVPNGVQRTEVPDKDAKWAEYLRHPSWVALLARATNARSKQDVVFYLSTDTDAPGLELREKLAANIGEKSIIKIIDFPQGCKDANEVLVAHGADALRECKANARPYPTEAIVRPSDSLERIRVIYNEGYRPGWQCGLPEVDKALSFASGRFSVITGPPGCGKTSVMNFLLPHYANYSGIRICQYSPEQPAYRGHAKIAEAMLRQSAAKGHPNQASLLTLERAIRNMDKWLVTINPERSALQREGASSHLQGLLDLARKAQQTEGMDWLILDPWNKIEQTPERGESAHAYVGRSLSLIDDFCKATGMHVTIIAHPRKLSVDKAGNYARVNLYDISDSAHWNNMPRLGITISRDRYDSNGNPIVSPTTMRVEKVSFEEDAQEGATVELYRDWYRGNTCVFDKYHLHPKNEEYRLKRLQAELEEAKDEEALSKPIITPVDEIPDVDFADLDDDPDPFSL